MLIFKDVGGNIVLTAQQGVWTGRQAGLVDPQGNKIGLIQKKGLQLGKTANYQFFDGNNTEIGQVTIKSGLMGLSEQVQMKDPNGNIVATATGNFAGFNYEIEDANGNKALAKISLDTKNQQQAQQEPGLGGMLASLATKAIQTGFSSFFGAYKVEILEKSINDMSRLFILELVVVLDEMYQPNQGGGFKVSGIPI